jgi:hypothetical protein
MLITEAAGTILRGLTLVPDVLGTLSVATLDNRYDHLAEQWFDAEWARAGSLPQTRRDYGGRC